MGHNVWIVLLLLFPVGGHIVEKFHISGRRHANSFDWTGVVVTASFSSSTCAILLTESGENRYGIYLNGNWFGSLRTKPGKHFYQLYSGLPTQKLNLTILKLTESCGPASNCTWADFGQATFEGLVLDKDAEVLAPHIPWLSTRRLEFIGDSITCGWGVEGGTSDIACSDGENASASWASLLSNRLQAERHTIAWGGIGLIQNDQADTLPAHTVMPALWERALANMPTSKWNLKVFLPTAVLLHLGTNDFTPGHNLSIHDFRTAYVRFLKLLETSYGRVPVFLACGPMGTVGDPRGRYFPCSVIVDVVSTARRYGCDAHFLNFSGIFRNGKAQGGCGHPSAEGHVAMADIAEPLVRQVLGWDSNTPEPDILIE